MVLEEATWEPSIGPVMAQLVMIRSPIPLGSTEHSL